MRPFEIIPAMDLRGGYAVRLLQGDYQQETRYHDDPIVVAQHWAMRGAPRLHVVDLDGAREGEPKQIDLIRRICRAVSVPVQVGGGVRSEPHIQHLLDAGVQRVILGTQAVRDQDFAKMMFQGYGDSIALALDIYGGAVAVEGWQSLSDRGYLEFAQQMVQAGVPRIIFTNIALDGTLQGFDTRPLEALLEAVSVPVIASGGVSNVEDIERLREMAHRSSLEGVIVGKALYEGTLPDTIWKIEEC